MKGIHNRNTITNTLAILFAATLSGCSDPAVESKNITENAQHYIDVKDYRTAVIELKNALIIKPDNADARFLLGKISLDVGELNSAIKELERAKSLGLNSGELALLLSEARLHNKELKNIIDNTSIDQSYATETQANLLAINAIAYQRLDQLTKSEAALNQAQQLSDSAEWVMLASIIRQIAIGDLAPADTLLAKALEKYPSSQQLWQTQAELSDLRQNNKDAEVALNQVIALDPPNIISAKGWRARADLVKLSIANGRIDKAESGLAPLRGKNPKHPEVNYLAGLIAFKKKDITLAEEKLLKVIKLIPGHEPTSFLLGAIQYQKQNYEQAVYYLLSYVSAVPSNNDARKLLGRAYIALGRPGEASAILEENNIGDGDSELIALIGLSEFQGGDIKQGIQNLEVAVNASPDDPKLRLTLVKAYMADGKTRQAIEELDKLIEDPNAGDTAEKMRILAYVYDKKYDKAIELSNILLQKKPNDETVLTLKASVLIAKSEFEESRTLLKQAIEINPNYALALMKLGRLDEQQGNPEQAIDYYKKIVNVSSNSVAAMMALARVSEKMGKKDDVGHWLSRSSDAAPQADLPRALLAEHYLRQREFEQAEAVINQLTKDYPKQPSTLALQGQLLVVKGQYNQAINVLQKLINLNPGLFSAHQMTGDAYLGLKDYDNSKNYYESALAIDEDNAVVINNLAWVYDQLNDERALKTAEKAYAENGENPNIKDTLGWILVKNGDLSRGHSLLEEASNRMPNVPEVKYRLAIAKFKLGEKGESENIIRELVASGAEFDYKEEAAKLLSEFNLKP